MPSTKAHTWLELPPNPKVDPAFLRQINDSMREIARQLDSASHGSAPSVSAGSPVSQSITGEAVLSVGGTLGIQSNAAPLLTVPAITPVAITALLKQPPQGGQVQVQLNAAGSKFITVTVAEGQVSGSAPGSSFAAIAGGSLLTLDIVAVGTTFPGSDLSLIVSF
jgi:hypothetical protein